MVGEEGKHCFQELPIQKSNRKSLYSVMQHDAKGSMDAGQRVGDKWLDTKLKNPVRHEAVQRTSRRRYLRPPWYAHERRTECPRGGC